MSDEKGKLPPLPPIKVIPANDGKGKQPTFKVWEVMPGDDTALDYDAEVLADTELADRFRDFDAGLMKPPSHSYATHDVLPQLVGRPWDQFAINMIHSLRPSGLRVSRYHHGTTLDGQSWRVTVYLEEDDRTIRRVEQEVEVGTVGAKHAHGLYKYEVGASPEPSLAIFNPRGLNRFTDKSLVGFPSDEETP